MKSRSICLAILWAVGLVSITTKNYLDFRLDFSADEPNELNLLAHFVAREMSWAGQFQIDELSWAELAKDLKMVSWAEPS